MTVIATCAFEASTDPDENLRRHLRAIDNAADIGAALVVFPECSLQGYPDAEARSTGRGVAAVWASAEDPLTGQRSRQIIERATARAIHVVYGLHERTDRPGVVHNTAVLTGPDGYIGAYRKVHLGATERAVWCAGDTWPVFDTALGRIGLMICVDQAWPESSRELLLGGAELLVMPTAWAFVVGGSDEIDARWADYYLLFQRARAAESFRWLISSNYAGHLGGSSYGGFSQIVDPLGRVRQTSETAPGMIHVDVDIRGEIEEAEANWFGPRPTTDRRTDTYLRQQESAPRRR